MDRFTSPVFLSVSKSGEIEEGVGGVPDHSDGRSILFVGNHQLLGMDMSILVSQVSQAKSTQLGCTVELLQGKYR